MPISGITLFSEGASLPNAITEIEIAAVKEPMKPWGVYMAGWEEYRETPNEAKLHAHALMIAALQVELLNAGNPIEDALDLANDLISGGA